MLLDKTFAATDYDAPVSGLDALIADGIERAATHEPLHRIRRKARRATQRVEHAKAELAYVHAMAAWEAQPVEVSEKLMTKPLKPAPLHTRPPAPTIDLWFEWPKLKGGKFTATRSRPDARGKLKSFEVQIPASQLSILRNGGQFWLVSVPIHVAVRFA